MANKKHHDLLKKGLDTWNQWRRKNPEIQLDLSNVDLRGANLSRANLSQMDLSRANLFFANLLEADLSRANLIRANLCGVDLRKANLRGADLSRANLHRAVGLTNEQIDSAITDKDTQLPAYLNRAEPEAESLLQLYLLG